nr:putative outer membrane protein pmp6 [Chlamydiota bacterium]
QFDSVSVDGCEFTSCIASSTSLGGAVFSAAPIEVTSSSFTSCTAGRGGAIGEINPQSIKVGGSINNFSSCTAVSDGGAIAGFGTVLVNGTLNTFGHCSAGENGGAIWADKAINIANSSIFSTCSADKNGGAIYGASTVSVVSSQFNPCTAKLKGGAIYSTDDLNVSQSSFTLCTAITGGAIFGDSGATITTLNNVFNSCDATGSGGGGAINVLKELESTGDFFHNCTTIADGGAIFGDVSAIIITENAKFNSCTSSDNGGAIYVRKTLDISDCSFNQCDAQFDGGAIYVEKTGTLTFSGPVSFSGNTANRGKDVFIESGVSFTVDTSANITIPNPIESNQAGASGTFIKRGSGKLSLNGDNTYDTVSTTIEEGELHVDGSIITDIDVKPGTTISGNLTTQKDLKNEGLMKPGDDGLGQIFVNGTFEQTTDGILEVDLTPTGVVAHKTYVVTPNPATVNGEFLVKIENGNYIKGTEYTIVQGPIASYSVIVTKTGALASQIDLSLVEGSLKLIVNNTVIFICPELPQGNPRMIIQAFDALDLTPASPMALIVEAFGQLSCPDPLATILNNMTAANYANLEWMTVSTDTQLSYILGYHAHAIKCAKDEPCGTCKSQGIWVSGMGGFENMRSFGWLSGYEADTGGVLAGLDFCEHPFYFGFAGGYTYTDFHLRENAGFGDIQSGFGAAYGGFISKSFIADASVIVGGKHFDMHRKIVFLTVNEVPHSTFETPFVNTHLGLMGQIYLSDFRLEAFGNIDYHYLFIGPVLEKGSTLDLFVNRHHSHFIKAEIGTNLKGIFKHQDICYAPFIGVSGVVKVPLGNTEYGAFFAGETFYQNTLTTSHSQKLVSPRCGVRIYTTSFIFMINYRGEFNKYIQNHQVDGSLEWSF